MEIPLFPLHTVLAPGIALPLHIFEPRYRTLVRHCLDNEAPFGIVLIREGSEVAPPDGAQANLSIAGVGTLAEIREAEKFSDGRWNLLVVGTSRFGVRNVFADRAPYLVADVELLPDEPSDAAEADELVLRVSRRFLRYLRLLQPRDGEQADAIDVQMELESADEPETGGPDAEAEAAAAGADRARATDADAVAEGPADADADAGRLARDPVRNLADAMTTDDPGDTLRIPSEPSALSFLLTGIVQVEPERRQLLLEAHSAVERLRELDTVLGHEMDLLRRRLAPFSVDRRMLAGSDN